MPPSTGDKRGIVSRQDRTGVVSRLEPPRWLRKLWISSRGDGNWLSSSNGLLGVLLDVGSGMAGPETTRSNQNDSDSSSGSSRSHSDDDGGDEFPAVEVRAMNKKSKLREALKEQKNTKKMEMLSQEAQDLTNNMNTDEMQQLVRLQSDMIDLKSAKGNKPLDEVSKLKIFQKAAKKVIAANRLASETNRSPSKGFDNEEPFMTRRRSRRIISSAGGGGNDFAAIEKLRLESEAALAMKEREDRIKMSGLAKFFNEDLSDCHHEDFDPGVNAMALLCGLVLSVPYTVVEGLDYGHLDWLKATLALCPEHDYDYAFIYNSYRASYTATVYFSIAGMIIATFYFLFKRNDDEDYRFWRDKARWMVLLLFVSTAMAIISLIFLTNLYFEYFLINTETDMCNAGTAPYVSFGMILSGLSFFGSLYLIM